MEAGRGAASRSLPPPSPERRELVRRRGRSAALLASAHLKEERELLILLDEGTESRAPSLAIRYSHLALHRHHSNGTAYGSIRVPASEICGTEA
jgi:hypothetical protein